MKILFLGYGDQETTLIDFLKERNHEVVHSNSKKISILSYDLVISFGYRHLINSDVILCAQRPIINLHISYLPFNRGAHPNFWSHYENTPCGVTIHEIDEGIDTGKIIFREKIELNEYMTLKDSHIILLESIESLFKEKIDEIENNTYKTINSDQIGTYHKKCDLPKWVEWDLTIKEVKNFEKQ